MSQDTTPSEKPATEKVYFLYVSDGTPDKAKFAEVTPEEIERSTDVRLLDMSEKRTIWTFDKKMGKRKHLGWVYVGDAIRKEDGGLTIVGGLSMHTTWRNETDIADWQTFGRAVEMAKQASRDKMSGLREMLTPVTRLYNGATFGQKAVIMHQVIKILSKGN